jgi:uncharacterized protein (DUF342 family)
MHNERGQRNQVVLVLFIILLNGFWKSILRNDEHLRRSGGGLKMQQLYKNEYLYIQFAEDKVFIEVFQLGFQIKDFDQVLKHVPRIAITQFTNLKNALESNLNISMEIGVFKPSVEIIVAKDFLEAKVRLNVTDDELEEELQEIKSEIVEALEKQNITEGILEDVLSMGLRAREEVVIARGIYPENGSDAIVTYFALSERKPVIQQDGTTDYYEMNFLDEVKKDEWLGEKIIAGFGTAGRTITGELLPAAQGKDKQMYYDKDTVAAVEEGDKIVLRAKINGAVAIVNGNIMVQEVLIIEGDVGSKTGNIDYDGSVIVRGTINDGFSLHATKDISVLSAFGLGAIDSIISRTGDIYIKGGVFGKEKALIQAALNVYMKHATDCTIQAGADIHIGLYAIGCKLTGNNIFLDINRGRIIGGKIQAKAQVVTAFIGNEAERSTSINIEGFDRAVLRNELDELNEKHQKFVVVMDRLKRDLDAFEETFEKIVEERTTNDTEKYEELRGKYAQIRRLMLVIEERQSALTTFLKTKGEGEVKIMRRAYPKTSLLIKDFQKDIEKNTTGVFFVKDKTLFFE